MYKSTSFFLGLAFFLTACQVDELVPEKPKEPAGPIWLQGSMTDTYSGEGENVDDLLNSVGLYAYNSSNQARYENNLFSAADSVLSTTHNIQYWLFDEQLTIYAYAPHRTITNPEAVPLTVESDQTSGIKNSDFLHAYQSGVSYHNWSTPEKKLSFTHALSKITVNFKIASGNTFVTQGDLSSSSVKIANTITNGVFNLKTVSGQLTAGSVRGAIYAHPLTTASEGYHKSFQAIIIPQTVPDDDVFLEIHLGQKRYTYQLTQPYTFESGKSYTFNINVLQSEIILNVSETPWVNSGQSGTGQRIKYKVGDYFPYPNDPAKATGVVFQVTDGTGYAGKVVSLQETEKKWVNIDIFLSDDPGCNSNTDGSSNQEKAIAYKGLETFFTRYPAFNWCYTYDSNKTGVWYLPARFELRDLRSVYKTINHKITSAGGTGISGDYYHSSTESGILVYALRMTGSGNGSSFTKQTSHKVRAIRRFDNT